MNNKKINKLKERASKAFSTKYKKDLANAVQIQVLKNIKIKPVLDQRNKQSEYMCPEGCYIRYIDTKSYARYPANASTATYSLFSNTQHFDFQTAFDSGADEGTPEAALGLLYRNKFVK